MIEKQKKEKGNARVSAVLFDDVSEVIYNRVKLRKVKPMTEAQYAVRGCTALLDAVGTNLNYEVLSEAVSAVRAAPSAGWMDTVFRGGEWSGRIREDYEERHMR